MYLFFNKRFDKEPTILSLNTGGIRQDQEEAFWETFVNVEESLYNSKDVTRIEQELFIKLPTVQSMTNFIFNSIDSYYQGYDNFFEDDVISERFPSDTCTPFSKKLFLTVNGKILACERIDQQYELGWITPKGIILDYKKIADRYNQWFSLIRRQCQQCYIFDRCTQCLFYLDLESERPVCKSFQSSDHFSLYNSKYISYFEKKPDLFRRILRDVTID